MSKTTAKGKGIYQKNSDLWDGSSDVLSRFQPITRFTESQANYRTWRPSSFTMQVSCASRQRTLWRAIASESKTARTIGMRNAYRKR